ncbi:cytochrome P450 [Crucibulum laeve]|uniref:Cytochrome P450 n=1 Tax=Crucibulum laeve TaxID=68775 RepID=A0A5C3LKJ9_9AGAR|nr:cytochrome P450 [Crucibulum laeve]
MLSYSSTILALISLALSVVSLFLKRRYKHCRVRYPPGPKPMPFIGNLFDIPKSGKPWLLYASWAKIYNSDILHFSIFGKHVFVLNSAEIITELFEKRSHIYSDRPYAPVADIMGWSFTTLLLPYGDKWRQHRRQYQQYFRKEASVKYHAFQTKKIRDMLRQFLNSPDENEVYYKTIGAAISMSSFYGYELTPPFDNDHMLVITEEAVQKGTRSLVPGAAIVNTFPALRHLPKWLPGIGFKEALEIRKLTQEMRTAPMRFIKTQMASGHENNSLLAEMLRNNDSSEESEAVEQNAIDIVVSLYAAGSETTVSAIATFILAMMYYPQVQKKAQEELDQVIGPDRLPVIDDRSSLPYIEAIYRETARWIPVANLASPHATSRDDIYNGYYIPKGSIVISNVWSVSHNPQVYPDPDVFKPERFFGSDGQLNSDEVNYAFGFGRRVCPGRHLASSTIWLTMASILAAFNVQRPANMSDTPFNYEEIFGNGTVSNPSFHSYIYPRSEHARRIVEEGI